MSKISVYLTVKPIEGTRVTTLLQKKFKHLFAAKYYNRSAKQKVIGKVLDLKKLVHRVSNSLKISKCVELGLPSIQIC